MGCNKLLHFHPVFLVFNGGEILGIWFPIMAFVVIGFQHVVANMFVIPAVIFAGHFSWADYFFNFVPVFIGNAIGRGVFVGLLYWIVHKNAIENVVSEVNKEIKRVV